MPWGRESASIEQSGTKRFALRISALRVVAAARKYHSHVRSGCLEAHSIEYCTGFCDSMDAVSWLKVARDETNLVGGGQI